MHHPDHLARREAAAGKLRQQRRLGRYFPLRKNNGEYRWFLSRALPIREEPDGAFPDGRILGWFGTNTDVADMREAEETLLAARDEAEEATGRKARSSPT